MVKNWSIPNVYINILREVHFMNAYIVRVNVNVYLYCIQVNFPTLFCFCMVNIDL